jgi:hypothetical protein
MDRRHRNTRTFGENRRNSSHPDDPMDMHLERESRERAKQDGEKLLALLTKHHGADVNATVNTTPGTRRPKTIPSENVPMGGSSMGLI